MKNYIGKEEYTYVLFGKEAIDLYKVSLKLLLTSTSHVEYKVGAFNDVRRFMNEQQKWDALIEIPENDYLYLKKYAFKSPLLDDTLSKEKKRFSILSLFKS